MVKGKSVPPEGKNPSRQTENPWTPRLLKQDKDRIARALYPKFCRVARGLGYEVAGGWIDDDRPTSPDTFYFKGEPPDTPNFTLRVKLNPYLDVPLFKKQMGKAGLPEWFVNSFTEQYSGQRHGVATGLERITGNWREWILDLRKRPGAEIWQYLTSSERSSTPWKKRLKKSGRSIDDLQLSKNAAIEVTALLFEKTGIAEYLTALERLRKLILRPLTK